jgi:hypothetical protein
LQGAASSKENDAKPANDISIDGAEARDDDPAVASASRTPGLRLPALKSAKPDNAMRRTVTAILAGATTARPM